VIGISGWARAPRERGWPRPGLLTSSSCARISQRSWYAATIATAGIEVDGQRPRVDALPRRAVSGQTLTRCGGLALRLRAGAG
jgi:hypothetical protein